MKIPTPKPHKTGQSYIYWQRKCIYFGKYGTPEADEKYWQWRKSMTGGASPTVKQHLVIDLLNLYASSAQNLPKAYLLLVLGYSTE